MWIQIKAMVLGVWEFLVPFIKTFLTKSGVALAQIALQVVADIAADKTLITDDEKRKAAFDRIKDQLIAGGISIGVEVTDSMINRAIEAAVAAHK
jgi:hypothetical protein